MPNRRLAFLFILLASLASASPAILTSGARFHPVTAKEGMVVAREALATEAGVEILTQGGNAADAAVAVGFALAVTTPQAGNLGGGGFLLHHSAQTGETVAIDFREKAPKAAHPDLFLDEKGDPIPDLSKYTHLAVGVPGSVAGLLHTLDRFGSLERSVVMAPAIRLAEEGFPVSRDLAIALEKGKERLLQNPEATRLFFDESGNPHSPGTRIQLPELAKVLRTIAKEGKEGFYSGWVADRLRKDMEQHGGILTQEDLTAYQVEERIPVRGTYRGFEIRSMPPPSSGGIHIVQMLNILETYDSGLIGSRTAASYHLIAEAMRRAYADRSRHLGDSDFFPVPLDWLASKDYAKALQATIHPRKATPSEEVQPGEITTEGGQTTHFSVIDAEGNAISCTTTINASFGNGYVVPGLGFFLNNEMDDFSIKPGVPNAYGLVGAEANKVEAEKRMLSSMSPTIVFKDGHVVLVLGSPGGSRIINSVLQVIIHWIDSKLPIAEAVALPRIHHQWLPDRLFFEAGISPDSLRILQDLGHKPQLRDRIGNVNAIHVGKEWIEGVADPRGPSGTAQGVGLAPR